MKQKMMSRTWFLVGMLSAATFGAFANIPGSGSTSGSMAPLEEVSEIKTKHHADLSFDGDLRRLSAIQGRYRENLPLSKRRVRPVKKSVPKAKAPAHRAKVGQR